MRPGEAPLEALAAAITRLWQLDAKDPDQAALPRKWAKGLSAGDNNLADLVDATQEELKKREGEAPERILFYVDQGEELYTRAAQRDAKRFSEVLAEGLGELASLDRACRNLVPAFPQRSPPWLLTAAACGGLRSAPDC